MSFVFPSWETAFSPEFYESAKGTLETALNKGNKPPVIQGRIEVVELSMGTQPPTLTLLEIGDLSQDRFRGILRLGYSGDAWLEVRCRVQANPLSHNPNLSSSSLIPLSTPLLASQPLLVPMTLRLSKLHLRAILILVVSASKGITLVFKNDPLQNVDVSSTFDSVEVIRGYLQQEIEGQLREMFREDLPGIIHRLSQRWLTGTGVGGRVEMPYRDGVGSTSLDIGTPNKEDDNSSSTDPYAEKPIFPPYQPTPSLAQLTPKRRALAQMAARTRRLSTALSDSPTAYTTFPDIEEYDPTYGLRPEGVPTHSGYEAFGRLWEKAREGGSGLGSLMRVPVGQTGMHEGDVSDESDEAFSPLDEEVDGDSVEDVETHQVLGSSMAGLRPGGIVRRASSRSGKSGMSRAKAGLGMGITEEDQVEWETYPAVGGGVITRPRVYHSQSQIRAPSEVGGGAIPSPSGTGAGSITARASSIGGTSTAGSMRRQVTGLRTPGLSSTPLPLLQPKFKQPQSSVGGGGGARLPTSTSASALAGPGPSSLRRMVTSRSDVFLSRPPDYQPPQPPVSAFPSSPLVGRSRSKTSVQPRRAQSYLPSAPSGSSTNWSTSDPLTQSSTFSTLPSSTSMSMLIPHTSASTSPSKSSLSHLRTPSTSFPPRGSIIGPGGITLPLNNSVSQLAALSHEAQTLSPYARGHEHIAVRSFPHLGRGNSGNATIPKDINIGSGGGKGIYEDHGEQVDYSRQRGNRKRVHRIGGGQTKDEEDRGMSGEGEIDDYLPINVSPIQEDYRSLARSSSGGRDIYGMSGLSMRDAGNGKKERPASLTGMASVLMTQNVGSGQNGKVLGGGMRPNLIRNPDSRSSYGFPEIRRYS